MKISIIIPIFNEEKYLQACLESLLSQTIVPQEIILVNDGSTNHSQQIIKEFSQKYSFRIIQRPHLGPSLARNFGAKKARGDILVFLDADMKFDQRYLEKLIRPITQKKAVATFTKEEYLANPDNSLAKC